MRMPIRRRKCPCISRTLPFRPPPSPRTSSVSILRLLGFLLLVAAGLKAFGFGADPIARTGVFSVPAFQFVVMAFELLLGVWLLSGKQQLGAWVAVLMTFIGFAAISFYQGCIGQASCGCLGNRVAVSPWIMFGIDLAAIVALFAARPDLNPLWEQRAPIARAAAHILGGYCLLLGFLAAFAQFRYGSIDAALADLRSERVSVNPPLIDIGNVVPGETRDAVVELTNRTDGPIRLIGGTADCSCTVIGDLPVIIPPTEARSIRISVHIPDKMGQFNRKAELMIDDRGFNRVGFRLTGRIGKAS